MVHHTKKHRKRNTRKRLNTRKRITHKRNVSHKRRMTRKKNIKYRGGACCASKPKSVSKKSKTRTGSRVSRSGPLSVNEIVRKEYEEKKIKDIEKEIFDLQEIGLRAGKSRGGKAEIPEYYSHRIKILENILIEKKQKTMRL